MSKVILSVTNDIVTDQRLHKVCTTLLSMGFDPLLVGRKRKKSPPLPVRDYKMHRMNLFFEKGPGFYIEYNIRLLFFLLRTKSDFLVSNDLDTLLANYFANRLKRIPLVYDSHEYFTEMPDLIGRKRVQNVWQRIENYILPKIKKAYTVSDPIAEVYKKKYRVDFKVVRNLPNYRDRKTIDNIEEKFIIYQGALNMGRGIEDVIRAMRFLKGVKLIIAGDGYLMDDLRELVVEEKLEEQISFTGYILPEDLRKITYKAVLGISLEEAIGKNHEYALPNKLFDYIQARIPVLGSSVKCIKNVVSTYKIGEIVKSRKPDELATQMMRMICDQEGRMQWAKNLDIAALELNWENEEKILKSIYEEFSR